MPSFDLGTGALALATSSGQDAVEALGGTVSSFTPLAFVIVTVGLVGAILLWIGSQLTNVGR